MYEFLTLKSTLFENILKIQLKKEFFVDKTVCSVQIALEYCK